MKPPRQSIAEMSQNEDYKFVAVEPRQVYPGYCNLHVYSDEDGVLWGAMEYMSDDYGSGDEPTEWHCIYAIPAVKYYFHDERPDVVEKRHREYEEELKRREAEYEAYNAPEAKRERSTTARAKLRATLARMQSDDPTPASARCKSTRSDP